MRFSFRSDLAHELRSILQGYPRFVFSGSASSLDRNVPVFVYHGIEPSTFERDLQFLAENRYRTLGMTELVNHLDGSVIQERAIVLSFDDARSSFWRYGYPLLHRYGMKGVLFVIAGLTLTAQSVRKNLLSVSDRLATREEIDALDPDDVTLCTWPELSHMHASGCVEVESHSLFHQEVFVGSKVLDFLGPDVSFVPFLTPATAYFSADHSGRPIVPEEMFGLPLFRAAPLHAGLPAWEVHDDLKQLAVRLWDELPMRDRLEGSWRRALRERWRDIEVEPCLRRQTTLDVERRIIEDMARARDLIKQNVDAAAGDHFCFPYTKGSSASLLAATRLGIKSCSWGVIPRRRHNAPGHTPMKIGRVKADFLWRLPGARRASLAAIYARKIERRLRGERVY